MVSPVDKIMSSVAALSSSDLETLFQKIQALRFVSPAAKAFTFTAQERHAQILYHALSSQLLAQLHIQPVPESVFFNKASASGLSKQAKESLLLAVKQLTTLAPKMTHTEWASVTDLVAALVVEKVRKGKFEMPWFGITILLKNLPQLLDDHFPGYASSNLLKLVLQLRVQKRTPDHVRNQPFKEGAE